MLQYLPDQPGRPILYGSLDDDPGRLRRQYLAAAFGSSVRTISKPARSGLDIRPAAATSLLVELDEGARPRELLRALVGRGEVESFTRFVPDLENIFIRAVEEDRTHAA